MGKIRVDGELLAATLATKHTVTNNTQATLVEIWFRNDDSVNRLVTVHFIPSGGSASAANAEIDLQAGNALRAGETRRYIFQPFLAAGDFIQWKADVVSQVQGSMSILEEAV